MRPAARVGAIPFAAGLASLWQQTAVLFHRFGGQQPTTPAFGLGETERTPPRIQNTPARSVHGHHPDVPFERDQDDAELARAQPVRAPGSWSMARWHARWHPWHPWQPAPGGRRAEAQKAQFPNTCRRNIGVFDHFRLGNFGISQPIADFRAKYRLLCPM